MTQLKDGFNPRASNSFARSGRAAALSVLCCLLLTLMLEVSARSQENKTETSSKPAAAAAPATDALAEVRRAIDKGNAQWIEGWAKKDPAMIAALFTEDGSLLSRGGRIIKGPAQIMERQRAAMQSVSGDVKVTVTTVDLWLEGETAYETGKYSYKYQEKGQPVTEEGRYVTIWKRQKDGSWKLFMDMGVPQN
ncbi:MAG TPA: nuclear transport factor 2 family protein [Pyrinomonadaceae bacterium]|nr:nuclear transport factor 2 family protein [Pyrinomonadaceae bacterium]